MRKLLFALAFFPALAVAQQSIQATGDYINDLGTAYGFIYSAKLFKDFCAVRHPEVAVANERAVNGWRALHSQVVEEIEAHWSAHVDRLALIDPTKTRAEFLELLIKQMEDKVLSEWQRTMTDQQKLRNACTLFPLVLFSEDRFQVEESLAEHLNTIRKVPRPIRRRSQ